LTTLGTTIDAIVKSIDGKADRDAEKRKKLVVWAEPLHFQGDESWQPMPMK
jgi:hypothetical protein